MTLSRIPGVAVGASITPVTARASVFSCSSSSKHSSIQSAEGAEKTSPVASSSGSGKESLEIEPEPIIAGPSTPGASDLVSSSEPLEILLPTVYTPPHSKATGESTTGNSDADSMKFPLFGSKSKDKGKQRADSVYGDASGSATAPKAEGSAAATVAIKRPTDPAGIPEPSGLEHCFPGYGDMPSVTTDAQVWYSGVRFMLNWGITDLKFAGGKYIGILIKEYPLRDSLNKIMWDDSLTAAEGAALKRFGRIYARAQGDSKDGQIINRVYLNRCGLDELSDALADIFQAEWQRRIKNVSAKQEVLNSVNEVIARLQIQVTADLAAKEAAKAAADKAAAEKAEDDAAKAAVEGKGRKRKGKGKGKGRA